MNESTPAWSTACWLALAIVALSATASRAAVPEPDNILYGNITLDGAPVTAARTDVVIEARRATNGPAIASYRIGSDPALGNFYSLRLLLESVPPITNTNASQVAQSLFIVVTDGTGLRAQTTFTITDRGAAQRVDFGAVVVDGDGDGLPDAWELLHFASLNRGTNSPGANGQTAWQNYLAGTDPNDPNSGFRLLVATSNLLQRVSFVALRAEGPGYEGLTRLHTLESNANLVPVWNGVAGFINVPGNNQTVVYQTVGPGAAGFFRGRITLQPLASLLPTGDKDGGGLPGN